VKKHIGISYALIVISLMLTACTNLTSIDRKTSPAVTQVTMQPVCQVSPIQPSKNAFPEARGLMKTGGEMWALMFFDQAHVKREEKIVWRITGTGTQFSVQAKHEDGTVILPTWGPDYHGRGSNWDRPGEEWGTGFNFPKPGCWTLTVTRGATIGEIRLEVLEQ
jgi:hypothetical protein